MTLFRGLVTPSACVALAVSVAFLAASDAIAGAGPQDAPVAADTIDSTELESADTRNLDEIFVFARKREEKLTDVPISISAFTAKALRDRNIDNAYDLASFTPNFNLNRILGRRLDNPTIRGQFGPQVGGTAPNASFFVDGVYIFGSIGSTSITNLAQVEVLRGPQSAQFGRATFAGAINYITRRPSDEFEGEVNLLSGQDGDRELGAWVSGPIIEDKLFFFVGTSTDQWDGEWRNGLEEYDVDAAEQDFFGRFIWAPNPQLPGDPPCLPTAAGIGCAPTVGDDTPLGGEETKIFTTKFTYTPTDELEFNFKYERSEADDGHYMYRFVPPALEHNCYHRQTDPLGNPDAGMPIDPRAGVRSGGWICGKLNDEGYPAKNNIPNMVRGVSTDPPGPGGVVTSAPAPFIGLREMIDRFYVDANADIGDYELTVRLAHNKADSEYVRDLDRSYALGPANTGLFEAYSRNELEDDSLEIRIASPADASVRWQAGYYWYDDFRHDSQRNFNAFGSSFLMHGIGDATTRNHAVFGDIAIDLTDSTTFAFEGRYARDKVKRFGPGCPADPNQCANETFYSFSPRATLTTALNDNETIYWQVAEGNKPGGFNFAYYDGGADFSRVDPADTIIQEEKATTYEFGWKSEDVLDDGGSLTATFALFFIDWKNQAINVSRCLPEKPGGSSGMEDPTSSNCQNNNIVENAGKSSVKGMELELRWSPTDYQTYTVGYGYTDAEVDEYIDEEFAILRCPIGCFETVPGLSVKLTDDAAALREEFGDVAGNKAPRVPEHNLAMSQLYQVPLFSGNAEWFVRNDLIYESKKYTSTSNLTWAPSAWTWNSRIGLETDEWSLAFYVNNITDEKSPIEIQVFPLIDLSQNYLGASEPGNPTAQTPQVLANSFQLLPRRSRNMGVTAQYRFGANR
ncbi:MAG: TonB-dependent receptor plug domain-containing protein [Gammaproteobacteria bacterium]|jgi:outer membrane receptor protein involved in Fe transport|nr:TonB-dependent receptor plug domain-containing protein [Gammaproteobacteria bacterium]MDP6616920.1 TonB-dependent receptor plug domain-containing protein [Gammaproteobacteria bacterium]MDP6694960.1 TonB-dependent receptor plug domain-containing protein [Gammaproteobacteria bacterium]